LSNVSDREAQPRRQQLTDGRRSRGYIPIEVELADARISNEALGLLVRIRRDSTNRETDGFTKPHELAALSAWVGLGQTRLRRLLQELEGAGLIETGPLGLKDHDYGCWSRTREEREERRRRWLGQQHLSRNQQLRQAIRERDGDQCQYCAITVDWKDRRGPAGGTYDHVDADGPTSLENLVVACRGCNSSKGDLPLQVFLEQTGYRFRSSSVLSLNRGLNDGPKDVLASRSKVKGQ
jgi:5-methylcytosine-specific restriction endonuclease McrA